MKLKYAKKNKASYALSLLAMSLSFSALASTTVEVGGLEGRGNTTSTSVSNSTASADLVDIKNEIKAQPSNSVSAEKNGQYIPLPKAQIAPQQQAVNNYAQAITNKTTFVASSDGGLRTIRKTSAQEDSSAPYQAPVAAQPVQPVSVASPQNTPSIIIPQKDIPRTNVVHATKLGNYQLNKKPYFYQCFHRSAAKYNVPVDLLIAIAQTESQMNTKAVGKNSTSEDLGVMQINTSWLPKLGREFGLKRHHLYEPCTNIDIGAWVLAHNFVQFGYTWNAVGAYNAKSPDKRVIYVRKVANNLEKLRRGEL